jgi:hypothetical protein
MKAILYDVRQAAKAAIEESSDVAWRIGLLTESDCRQQVAALAGTVGSLAAAVKKLAECVDATID